MLKADTTQTSLQENARVGAALREAREARGLSWSELAEECKLQERFLQALEEGHTDYLPAHIYFRMFARLYADTLGLDPDALLGRLYPEAPPPEYSHSTGQAVLLHEDGTPVTRGRRPAIELATASRPAPSWTPPPTRPAQAAPGGSALGLTLARALGGRSRLIGRTIAGIAAVAALFFVGKYTVLSNGLAQDGANPMGPGEATEELKSEESLKGLEIAPYERGELELTARATGRTRLVVVADGDTVFSRSLQAGEALTWKSNYRFEIEVADQSLVEFFIGGQKLKPAPEAEGSVTAFEVNQLNYQELLLGSAPGGADASR
ncbi:MAG TPA: RodZ domain-containing protein [candidate division Zixibacteria bacterium]|nr:RodZ domain-containing protein [candidate division Zixibacteria bacterium]